ncbi:MAG: hypothetical protein JKY03_09685 [Aureispira sp.]|nr:hypothetical protein [Aureispira sp.]
MEVSQIINPINDNNYDDDITVTDVPKGRFLAVTANKVSDDGTKREITVQLFQLEQATGGTQSTNSGLFVKGDKELSIKVTVSQDGTELATNEQAYP